MVWTDYLLALPIMLLTLFALGILLIDFMLPKEWKWANAVTAFIGVMFSAAGVYKIQMWLGNAGGAPGMLRTMVVDRFAIYFFYLFLAGDSDRHPDVGALSRNRARKPRRVLRADAVFGRGHDVHGRQASISS